jgi:peptide/nickel transport system substrate-binding protein
MRRFGLAAIFLAVIAAGAVARAAPPVSLVVPVISEPRTLSPDFAADPGGYAPTDNIYSFLVTLDWGVIAGTPAYGDLATSWEYSPDLRTVTFHLHDNVEWHDGVPLTADDVVFTFQRIIDKKYPYAAYLRDVASLEAPDATTVVFHLTNPDVSIVPMMAQAAGWTGKIYPKHLWETQAGFDTGPYVNKPVGSGPFRFVSWSQGVVELAANPDYFRGKPKIDHLYFRYTGEPGVARADFDAGNIPFLSYEYGPPWAEVPDLQKDPTVRVVLTPSQIDRSLQFNMTRKPYDDIRVRRAIAMSVDRDAMSKLAFNGFWKPTMHASVEGTTPWINRDASFPAYDPAAAEKLLDEAGLPRKAQGWRFSAQLTGPTYPDCTSITQVLAEQLRKVGINATIEPMDLATWFQRIAQKKFDINCFFTIYGPDPDQYRLHFGTDGPRNYMGFSNAEFDALTVQGVRTADQAARMQIYDRMQAILVENIPYVALFTETKVSLERAGWTGFSVDPDGYDKSLSWFGQYAVQPPKDAQ